MEILSEFGINPVLLGAQIVNFLIILFLVKRFALKPIMQVLKQREETIKEGLKSAEEARIRLEQATEKEKAILKKAHAEAKILLEDTQKQSQEILASAEKQARKQTEKILLEAREQIASETREAEKRLAEHASTLAIQFLQKAVAELLTEREQEIALKRALQKIKKIN